MSNFPDKGIKYKDSIKTATRHAKEGSINIVNSMAGQVNLHEGPKAAREFAREAISRAKEQKGKQYFT